MEIVHAKIKDVLLLKPNIIRDERGFFCQQVQYTKLAPEIDAEITFTAISQNKKQGTLRGLHYQLEPYQQSKFVSCIKGAFFDVIVDLRKDSPTFGQVETFELDDHDFNVLYIPAGCAHGFQTLMDDTHVYYAITGVYQREAEAGIVFNSQALDIKWPMTPTVISERDQNLPSFDGQDYS